MPGFATALCRVAIAFVARVAVAEFKAQGQVGSASLSEVLRCEETGPQCLDSAPGSE